MQIYGNRNFPSVKVMYFSVTKMQLTAYLSVDLLAAMTNMTSGEKVITSQNVAHLQSSHCTNNFCTGFNSRRINRIPNIVGRL